MFDFRLLVNPANPSLSWFWRYPLLKYLFILMIVAGVAMFMYKDGSKKTGDTGAGLIGVGEILLLVSLTCDGLTGAIQERMKLEHATKSGEI